MSKKKKIIIVSICLAVIILGAVIGIIIATRKKFDITGNYQAKFNTHTSMEVVSLPQGYTDNTNYYSNGTIITQKTDTGKYGVYSYIKNEIVVPAEYSNGNIGAISIATTDGEVTENVFRAIGDDGQIDYYNDEGVRLSITEFDSEELQNYGYIKERDLKVSEKRKGIKVNTSDDFDNKKIAITSAEFNVAYTKTGGHNYERWTLTDTNGNMYDNLYKVKNGNRVLVQTLNNYVGSNIGSSMTGTNATYINVLEDLTPIFFLKDGTPMLVQSTITQVNDDGTGVIELTIYDIHFNSEGSAQVTIDDNLYNMFRVGNSIFFQYKIPATEKKYDFAETTTSSTTITTNYFNLETYRFNLSSGKYSEVSFDYLIEEYNSEFNVATILTHARKIKDKTLQSAKLLLLNDSLQTKEIDYEFNYLTRITSDRYIAHSDNGAYLIDSDYDRICYLGTYDNIFTTKDAVMLSNIETGYTYVCDMEGTIVRRYMNSEIINIYDDTYYMIETQEEDEEGNSYRARYLERLGVRDNDALAIIKDDITYTYNNTTYIAYNDDILSDGVSIITRVKQESDGSYTYDFYNIKGQLLRSIPNFETSDRELVLLEEFDDYYLVYISTNKGGIGYTMIVNK